VELACGIPEITLEGEEADYESILLRTHWLLFCRISR
jgi:hypothetical protein